MKIELTNHKGKQVETKTGQSSYLFNSPIFDSTDISVDDVPINKNLESVFKILSEGDGKPFFFISEMKLGDEFPTAYDDIMTTEWANSFIEKLDTAPFPLSAMGHTNVEKPMERVESHGYVVGGKVQDNSMFLRNYILPGKTDATKEFAQKTIREMKSGMLSTSISNYQKYVKIVDDTTLEAKWYVVESIQGQRNDIVEHDLTGSEASIVARSFKTSEETEAQKSVNLNTGDQSMDKLEMLKKLSVLKTNGDLSNGEIAKTFGLELVTADMKSASTNLKTIQDELGEGNSLEIIKALKTKAGRVDTAEFEKVKSEALKEAFKTSEVLLPYAEELFVLKSGTKEECVAEAKRISEMRTLKDMASKLASGMIKKTELKTSVVTDSSNALEM